MKKFFWNSEHAWFRWFLLVLIFGAAFLNYVDRQAVSFLKETLKGYFEVGDAEYGWLVNAFMICYAVAYVGSGWMVDKIGPRLALLIFAGVWSLITVGCGLVQGFTQLIILRALLGMAEPGLQPVSIRVASAWAPVNQRGLFMSLCGVGSSIGYVASAGIIVWLTLNTSWGWRSAFVWPGLAGLLIAAVWWIFYRDPKVLPVTGVAKLEEVKVPVKALKWGSLWGMGALWGIVLARLVSDPAWYFITFWFPGYLQTSKHGLSLEALGRLGWLPFFASSLCGIAVSVVSDWMAKRDKKDRLEGRKRLLFWVSWGGLLYATVPWLERHGSLWGTIAVFCVLAAICACWLSTLAPIIAEIFPIGNVASVWGIAGAFGAGGAIVFNYLLGKAGDATKVTKQVALEAGGGAEVWTVMDTLFVVMGGMHLLAALLLFLLVRRAKVVTE